MKTRLCCALAAICLATISFSFAQAPSQPQTAAQPQGTAPATPSSAAPPMAMNFTPGTLIRVELEKPIDAKKAEVGDRVLAKTTDDLKSIPPSLALKGCKIIGHIVEVTPHQGDTPSTIRIVFDRMILKNNSDMALPATIKAVGFADQFNPATDAETIDTMGGNGFGHQSGANVTAGGGNPNLYAGGRMPGGAMATPTGADVKLPFNAKGAIGMSGVTLSPGTAHDSILTSKKKNVRLDNGMQMILKTD